MTIRVAGIQMAVSTDVSENVVGLSRAIRLAAEAHADILLTPEGSLSGYTPDFDPAVVAQALDRVTTTARERGIGLALGTCFREADGLTYNELRFYSRDGAYLGCHSKILRCGSMTDPLQGEINHYATTPLRGFNVEGVVAGGLICNDMWANPECTPMPDLHLSQQLAGMGARIIFHAVNGGRDGSAWSRDVVWRFHEANLRMRARAGRLYIVTVDNSFPADLPCASPSGVINPEGEWVCQVDPQGERFFAHTIDLLNSAH